jgi:hypothetical protein
VSPKQALARFVRISKRVVQTSVLPSDRYLFRPAKTGLRRLRPIAITSHMGAICAIPMWSESVAEGVVDAILKAGKGWNREKETQKKQGDLSVIPEKFTLARLPTPSTNRSERDWCEVIRKAQKSQRDLASQAPGERGTPEAMIIACPSCRYPRQAMGQITLLKGAAFRLIVCPSCKVAKQSSQWLCACGIKWHSCAIHLAHGQACKAKERCPRGQLARRQARRAIRHPAHSPSQVEEQVMPSRNPAALAEAEQRHTSCVEVPTHGHPEPTDYGRAPPDHDAPADNPRQLRKEARDLKRQAKVRRRDARMEVVDLVAVDQSDEYRRCRRR